MSLREAILRFHELHQEFKAGAFKSPEARAFYESERDDFVRALVQAQQLALRPGQSARQALRIGGAVSLELHIGPRHEETTTIDVGSAGFAALVSGPLAVRIVCDFMLGFPSGPVHGRARVVACARDGVGAYRTSFAIEGIAPEDRERLDVAVIDAALVVFPRR
jgi:hypothetical protein